MEDHAKARAILSVMIECELATIATNTQAIAGQTNSQTSKPELIQQIKSYFGPGADSSNFLKMEGITSAVARLDTLTKARDYLVKYGQ
jgi:hypothetical protein